MCGAGRQISHRLLNVEKDVGSRDLRRAYTRLIRQFKPEHSPEEFRRIRDAYESLQQIVEWKERFAPSSVPDSAEQYEEAATVDGDLQQGTPAASEEQLYSSQNVRITLKSLDEELDELWQQSCEGGEEAAYFRLKTLSKEHSGSEAICVRLYWLLRIARELDADLRCSTWLMTSATTRPESRTLRELLRREIELQPGMAYSPEFIGLLKREVESEVIYDLLSARWRAAVRLDRWPTLETDLERLKPRLENGEPLLTVRLQILAAEKLLWNPVHEPTELLDKIEENQHFQLELQDVLDRLETLRQVALEWRTLLDSEGSSNHFVKMMPSFWQDPPEIAERQLLEFAARCMKSPDSHFRYLDSLRGRMPSLLLEVWRRLNSISSEPCELTDEGRMRIHEFFVETRFSDLQWLAKGFA